MEAPKPTPEPPTHVRPREAVEQMVADAEREAHRQKLNERLGGVAVVHSPEDSDTLSSDMIQRLEG